MGLHSKSVQLDSKFSSVGEDLENLKLGNVLALIYSMDMYMLGKSVMVKNMVGSWQNSMDMGVLCKSVMVKNIVGSWQYRVL